MSTFIVKDMEQASLLTDAFKMQILLEFAEAPVTTKQVADKMALKAPRLYRHVDQLINAGLLELKKEQPKRGTIERYYQAIAKRFEIDPELFTDREHGLSEAAQMVNQLLTQCRTDLMDIFQKEELLEIENEEDAPLIGTAMMSITRTQARELRSRLNQWLTDCNALNENTEQENTIEVKALLAFYEQI